MMNHDKGKIGPWMVEPLSFSWQNINISCYTANWCTNNNIESVVVDNVLIKFESMDEISRSFIYNTYKLEKKKQEDAQDANKLSQTCK